MSVPPTTGTFTWCYSGVIVNITSSTMVHCTVLLAQQFQNNSNNIFISIVIVITASERSKGIDNDKNKYMVFPYIMHTHQ